MSNIVLAKPIFDNCECVVQFDCGIEYIKHAPMPLILDHASKIGQLTSSAFKLRWFVGDILIAARDQHGEEWSQVSAEFEQRGVAVDYQNWSMWICDKFPPCQRNPNLTPGHHAAVVKLLGDYGTGTTPDGAPFFEVALHWLEKAVEQGWSAEELRKQVQEYIKRLDAANNKTEEEPETDAERIERMYKTAKVTPQFVVSSLLAEIDASDAETKEEVIEVIEQWRP